MTNRRILNTRGFILVVLLCIAAAAAALFIEPPACPDDFGICLPSPNIWPIEPFWAKLLNAVCVFGAAGCIFLLNKHFSIIKTSQPLWASLFLSLCCGNALLTGRPNQGSAVFLCLLAAICMVLLSYKRRNATKLLYSAAALISLGSAFEYAFIIFAAALLPAAAEMKVFRFKEVIAILLGFITPYWIGLGLGIVTPADFHPILPSPIFLSVVPPGLFAAVVVLGVLLLATLLLTLNNLMKLYAGNSRLRNCVNVINIFGLAAALGIVFDFRNIMAYVMMFNMWCALQLGIIFTLWNFKKGDIIYWIIQGCVLLAASIEFICII